MYERTYGSKYQAVTGGTKAVAAAVRKDVAAAVKTGVLPQGLKVSVRMERYSGGSSIYVTVTKLPEGFEMKNQAFDPNEYWDPNGGRMDRYTPAMRAVLDTLKAMLDAYNHDGSDSMTDYFDVRFYGHVSVDWKLERD